MKHSVSRVMALLLAAAMSSPSIAGAGEAAAAAAPSASMALGFKAAERLAGAANASILAAAQAGKRMVAVGDHGVVLLSDDGGHSFWQARQVPVQVALTGVHFADERQGWAVGHRGVILHTDDGGDSWSIQRQETAVDQPLFSVFFWDAHEGIAVGLWSLVLKTADGGKSWTPLSLPVPPAGGRADKNLYRIFQSKSGALFVAAEQGLVLKTEDRGANWHYLATGYKGTFWSGTGLDDGSVMVGGLRGSLYRSRDDGRTWSAVTTHTKSSITDIVATGGVATAVALDGVSLHCPAAGEECAMSQREDRLALTAVSIPGNGAPVIFSKKGPLPSAAASGGQ